MPNINFLAFSLNHEFSRIFRSSKSHPHSNIFQN
jgi:hypothetical protein